MIDASAAANCMVKISDNHSMTAPRSDKKRVDRMHGRLGRDALQTMDPVEKVLLDTGRLGPADAGTTGSVSFVMTIVPGAEEPPSYSPLRKFAL